MSESGSSMWNEVDPNALFVTSGVNASGKAVCACVRACVRACVVDLIDVNHPFLSCLQTCARGRR
jgi:hypothetical protein